MKLTYFWQNLAMSNKGREQQLQYTKQIDSIVFFFCFSFTDEHFT